MKSRTARSIGIVALSMQLAAGCFLFGGNRNANNNQQSGLGGARTYTDSDVVTGVATTSSSVYVATLRGVIKYPTAGGESRRMTTEQGLPDNQVFAISAAGDTEIWAATAHGVVRWVTDHWAPVGDGQPDVGRPTALLALEGGQALLGGAQGIARFDGQHWSILTNQYQVTAFAMDSGRPLVATANAGVLAIRGDFNSLDEYGPSSGVPETLVRALVPVGTGRFWALVQGTQGSKLAFWDGHRWYGYTSERVRDPWVGLVSHNGAPALVLRGAVYDILERRGEELIPTEVSSENAQRRVALQAEIVQPPPPPPPPPEASSSPPPTGRGRGRGRPAPAGRGHHDVVRDEARRVWISPSSGMRGAQQGQGHGASGAPGHAASGNAQGRGTGSSAAPGQGASNANAANAQGRGPGASAAPAGANATGASANAQGRGAGASAAPGQGASNANATNAQGRGPGASAAPGRATSTASTAPAASAAPATAAAAASGAPATTASAAPAASAAPSRPAAVRPRNIPAFAGPVDVPHNEGTRDAPTYGLVRVTDVRMPDDAASSWSDTTGIYVWRSGLGVSRIGGGPAADFRAHDLAFSHRPLSIATDSDNNVWMVTEEGSPVRYDGSRFSRVTLDNEGNVVPLMFWSRGTVAAAVGRVGPNVIRTYRWGGNTWRQVTERPIDTGGPGTIDVKFLAVDEHSRFWIGLRVNNAGTVREHGVAVLDDNLPAATQFNSHVAPTGAVQGAVPAPDDFTAVEFDSNGVAWFAGLSGATSIQLASAPDQAATVHTYNEANGLRGDLVSDVVRGPQNRIYIATTEGIGYHDGNTWSFDVVGSSTVPRVIALAVDVTGNLWGAGQRGAWVYDGSHFRTVGRNDGLPNDSFTDLQVDGENRVWFVTADGISILTQPRGGSSAAAE